MQPRVVGGYEWQSAEKVTEYLDREKEPEREAEFRAAHQQMLDLLPFTAGATFEFLDLGAGAGAVSASLMERFPKARGVLADMSAPMMQAGGERLAPFSGRYRYVALDMNGDVWPAELAGPFGAVVSARAIHHLPNDRKLAVFQHVYERLAPGGVFINWDIHRDLERELTDPGNVHNRTAASVDEHLDMLRSTGFESVQHIQREKRRAIFFAVKR
ncbi:MAG TPA: class I SAM-dependent methyltransferase [Chloroflexota bacterium]|nr:class I SAM-dependent methyltransferase [Chloroflexota bacterium]